MQSRLGKYKEIAEDYIAYLENEKNKLSSWRNFFTGTFYRGQYARYMLRDMLAGGVKNNFLFGIFKKSEYANFIALIDRICKLDSNAMGFLKDEIIPVKSETVLLDSLFEYFLSIQKNTKEKNEIYYKEMKMLKRDIHHLAKEHNINTRIKKNITKENNLIYYRAAIQNDENEKEKDSKRRKKTWFKRIAKIMASGMGIAEISMALGGFLAIALILPFGVLILFKAAVVASGVFFGYLFAKNELIQLSKDIFFSRLFKVKHPITGNYEELNNYQKAAILLLSPFSIVAGISIGALSFSSVVGPFGLVCGIGIFSFVFCLATAAFFLTVKNIVSHIEIKKIGEYINSLRPQENEKSLSYSFRLFLELLKWGLAISIMALVVTAGYHLFKDKCIDLLKNIWVGLTVAQSSIIASSVAFAYSFIKFPFGVKKIIGLMQSGASAVKNAFSSSQQLDSSLLSLNIIQQRERSSQLSSTAMGLVLLTARTGASGGYYYKAGSEHFSFPHAAVITGTAAAGFIYSINAMPFLAAKEKTKVKVLNGMRKGR